MIEVKNLVKKYSGNPALLGISFTADKGEIVGLLGPNGAGKSTTMNIITGYIEASEGTVTVDGFEIGKNPKEVKKRIGYLPETAPLYTDMTVSGYLNFVCALKGVKSGRKEHIADILEITGLADCAKRLIKNLSKGYRQRVGIAQALVGNPQILILDEPTAGLDPAQILQTLDLIKTLREDRVIIISSHVLSEISACCDRVLVINKGSLAADVKTSELSSVFSKNKRLSLEIEGDPDTAVKYLERISGVVSVSDNGETENGVHSYTVEYREKKDIKREVFKNMSAANLLILKMEEQQFSLEQVFLQLTSDGGQKGGKKK